MTAARHGFWKVWTRFGALLGAGRGLVAVLLRRTLVGNDVEDFMRGVGEKKQKCKNCEGKRTLKKGDKVVRCQRCSGTGIKS
jgi:hypothetical protein